MPFTYEYPRPAVTVDCVVFALDEEDLKVLLIRRDGGPALFKQVRIGEGGEPFDACGVDDDLVRPLEVRAAGQ